MQPFSLQANYIDLIILLVLGYFISVAWREGFWSILADFLGFLLSLLVALKFFSPIAALLRLHFSLSHTISNALGFLFVASLSETLFSHVFLVILKRLPAKLWQKPWNNILAIIPALGQGIVIISFVLMLIIGFPVAPALKSDVVDSKIGGYLIKQTSGVEVRLKEVFGGLIEDSITYLTVKPGSSETIPIRAKIVSLTFDEESERHMLTLINDERTKRGIKALTLRSEVTPVARAHASDMWRRNYFGHVSPDGHDAGDRLTKEGVSFQMAGENLALAPTLPSAHTGLMNSDGHRANILDLDFKRVGIGVVDNGYYGKIFVQVFTD